MKRRGQLMGLQRKVIYLETQHVAKLHELQQKWGLANYSAALRFLIDSIAIDSIGDLVELKVWSEILQEQLAEAIASSDKAEHSLDQAIKYFGERCGRNEH
jgi:hypothetical protein